MLNGVFLILVLNVEREEPRVVKLFGNTEQLNHSFFVNECRLKVRTAYKIDHLKKLFG